MYQETKKVSRSIVAKGNKKIPDTTNVPALYSLLYQLKKKSNKQKKRERFA